MTYYLGDRYYVVKQNGFILPKIILSLPFTLGQSDFIDFEEALAIAIPRLKEQILQCDSRKQEAVLQAVLEAYQMDLEWIKQLYKSAAVSFSNEFTKLIGLDELQVDPASIPERDSYLQPGGTVFVAITPKTHYTMSQGWRPAMYFILRVRLKSTSWTRYGLRYSIDSFYQPSRKDVFASLKEARDRLTELILEQVPAASVDRKKIQNFNAKAEKQYWSDWHDRKSKERFGRLSAGAD